MKWLEAGRVDIGNEEIQERFKLLRETLDTFSSRVFDGGRGTLDDDVLAGIKMCHDCGSVVGIERCCDEHPNLVCASCGERRHPDEVAS